MGDIRGWITGICLSLLAAGLVKMLSPGGGAGKMMNMLLSLFVLCAVCVPVAGGLKLDLELPETSAQTPEAQLDELDDALERQTEELAADKLREQLEIVLAKYEIKNGKISIGMDRLDDNSIFIREIVIYIPDEQAAKAGDIGRTIKTELGLDTLILSEKQLEK